MEEGLVRRYKAPEEKNIKVMSGNIESNNRVEHPKHYSYLKELCGVEVIDITRHLDFDCGNVVKYVLRHGHKDEEGMSNIEKAIEDLKKARWYLDDKIKMLEEKL